tara:strand:+ start:8069 stop:9649 length:1581 start_codon:yes stop_codon:yes gene_type:complete
VVVRDAPIIQSDLYVARNVRKIKGALPSPLLRYYDRPDLFFQEAVYWKKDEQPTDYQLNIARSVQSKRRVSVRSPHGVGKTASAALIILWFALTRDAAGDDWKIVTTAGRWSQLRQYLWPEVHKWAKRLERKKIGRTRFSRYELLRLSLQLMHGNAFAVASDNHEAIEGAHADQLLYVFDEAKLIQARTFDAAEGAFSGGGAQKGVEAFALAISTPGAPTGRFYDIQTHKPGYEDWHTIHVTMEEAIECGRMSKDWVAARERQWGKDSALFQNRIMGQFATQDETSVIPLAWVEDANERWLIWRDSDAYDDTALDTLGVDIGLSHDKTSFAFRSENIVTQLRRYGPTEHKGDTMVIAGKVKQVLDKYGGRAIIDAIGIGSGVVHRLAELKMKVAGFNAGERSDLEDRSGTHGFVNKRSAGWWTVREYLDPAYGENVALPPDDLLTGDLTAPQWTTTSGGKVSVEKKDEIRERLGRSTDDGDAVVHAFWSEGPAPVDMAGPAPPESGRERQRMQLFGRERPYRSRFR